MTTRWRRRRKLECSVFNVISRTIKQVLWISVPPDFSTQKYLKLLFFFLIVFCLFVLFFIVNFSEWVCPRPLSGPGWTQVYSDLEKLTKHWCFTLVLVRWRTQANVRSSVLGAWHQLAHWTQCTVKNIDIPFHSCSVMGSIIQPYDCNCFLAWPHLSVWKHEYIKMCQSVKMSWSD